MQKDPWWVRHRTIGTICGIFLMVFALIVFGILSFFDQVWMYFQGYNYVPGCGYVHRKTGARR